MFCLYNQFLWYFPVWFQGYNCIISSFYFGYIDILVVVFTLLIFQEIFANIIRGTPFSQVKIIHSRLRAYYFSKFRRWGSFFTRDLLPLVQVRASQVRIVLQIKSLILNVRELFRHKKGAKALHAQNNPTDAAGRWLLKVTLAYIVNSRY